MKTKEFVIESFLFEDINLDFVQIFCKWMYEGYEKLRKNMKMKFKPRFWDTLNKKKSQVTEK